MLQREEPLVISAAVIILCLHTEALTVHKSAVRVLCCTGAGCNTLILPQRLVVADTPTRALTYLLPARAASHCKVQVTSVYGTAVEAVYQVHRQ